MIILNPKLRNYLTFKGQNNQKAFGQLKNVKK